MAEAALGTRSPLADVPAHAGAHEPGVVIAEQPAGGTFAVLARRGVAAALVQRARDFGVVLPSTPQRAVGRGHAAQWTGPGQWQVQAAREEVERLRGLFASVPALCSTVVLDDSRIVLSVAGPRARDTLAKMLTIDLHPRAFRPGEAAVTVAGGISVLVSRGDDEDVFDCAVPRSVAVSFWDWLTDSAAEYGVATSRTEDRTRIAQPNG